MPSGSFFKAYVKCPFYIHDEGRKRIVCEGIIYPSNISQSFGRQVDFERHITTFCSEHYKKCEIYQMLMSSKYEDED